MVKLPIRRTAIHTFSASTTYLPACMVLILVVTGWSVFRQWKPGLLTLMGSIAFLFVFLVTFHAGNSAVMQDRGVLPVATIIALSTAAFVLRLDGARPRMVALVLAAAVLFVKVRDLSFASRPFMRQYAVLEGSIRLADEQGIARGIVDCQRLREQDVEVSWAFPVETLLRSAVRGPELGRVLVCSDNLPAPHMLSSGQVQVLQFAWAVDKNGNRYFHRVDLPYRTVVQP